MNDKFACSPNTSILGLLSYNIACVWFDHTMRTQTRSVSILIHKRMMFRETMKETKVRTQLEWNVF